MNGEGGGGVAEGPSLEKRNNGHARRFARRKDRKGGRRWKGLGRKQKRAHAGLPAIGGGGGQGKGREGPDASGRREK